MALTLAFQGRDDKEAITLAALKRWKEIDCTQKKEADSDIWNLSNAEFALVEKAVKYLPKDHVLLNYLAFNYSHTSDPTYQGSMAEYEPRGPEFERFLYGVNWYRYVSSLEHQALNYSTNLQRTKREAPGLARAVAVVPVS